jgi:hypothetical protein
MTETKDDIAKEKDHVKEMALAQAEEQAKAVFKSMAEKQLSGLDLGDGFDECNELAGEVCDWLGARSLDGPSLKASFYAVLAVVLAVLSLRPKPSFNNLQLVVVISWAPLAPPLLLPPFLSF